MLQGFDPELMVSFGVPASSIWSLKAIPVHYNLLFKIAIHDTVTQACMHDIVLELKQK